MEWERMKMQLSKLWWSSAINNCKNWCIVSILTFEGRGVPKRNPTWSDCWSQEWTRKQTSNNCLGNVWTKGSVCVCVFLSFSRHLFVQDTYDAHLVHKSIKGLGKIYYPPPFFSNTCSLFPHFVHNWSRRYFFFLWWVGTSETSGDYKKL